MKKLILILIFFLILICFKKNDNSQMVMGINSKSRHYELIFTNDNLNFRNFKLKLGLFTSYDYNISKVYIKYNESVKEYFKNKEYFSFDNSNFNDGIEKLKDEYNLVLENNYLYNELDKDINDVTIEKVELYASLDALDKFKSKYPNVTVKYIK